MFSVAVRKYVRSLAVTPWDLISTTSALRYSIFTSSTYHTFNITSSDTEDATHDKSGHTEFHIDKIEVAELTRFGVEYRRTMENDLKTSRS